MKRLFFALWPSDEVRKQTNTFNHSINAGGLKKVKADNLHVSLVFLGNVDAESEILIRQSVDNISVKPFSVYFDRLDFWRKPRILCLSTAKYDAQLLKLVDALKCTVEQCGIKIEDRPYKPHVTLARKAHKLIDVDVLPIEWTADSFCLVESFSTPDGVHYQVLQRWDFE
ncbi:MAG: RNA 2',3'-cyclic phosphodiesterase [Methylomarinum sp.]|nr:RNA 2',3'-cyclic phosphodiesterase [Methylomarinum sp.]